MKSSSLAGIATATILLVLSKTSVAGSITGTLDLAGAFQPTENGVSTQNIVDPAAALVFGKWTYVVDPLRKDGWRRQAL